MIWVRFLVLFALIPLILSEIASKKHLPKKFTISIPKNKEKLSARLSKFKIRPRRQMNDDFVDEFANDDLPPPISNFLINEENRMRTPEEILLQPPEENFEDFDVNPREADPDPHLHSHSHSHVHSHQHSHFREINHHSLPTAHFTTPGINLNLHQNQQQQQIYNAPVLDNINLNHHQNQQHHQIYTAPDINLNQHQSQQQHLFTSPVLDNINLNQHQSQQQLYTSPVLDNINYNHHPVSNRPIIPHQASQQQSQFQNLPHLRENQEEPKDFEKGDGQAFDPFNQVDEVMDFLSRHPTRLDNNQRLSTGSNLFRAPLLPNYYHGIDSIFSKNSETLGEPNIFSVPPYHDYSYSNARRGDLYKRSLDFNALKQKIDENCKKFMENPIFKVRVKKSIPIARLLTDPKAKLDIPKTLENVGTITRQAFEDERAPMFHVKNLIGSGKDTLLSAMRIPPQNLVIPSDYEIIKAMRNNREELLGGINPEISSKKKLKSRLKSTGEEQIFENSPNFSHTFQRVGEIVRDSIKSGQDTASHIGDIAHDARNILKTAKYSVPRLVIPISRIPAVKEARKPVLITPRIFDLAESNLGSKVNDNNKFVKFGHLMDAVGLSNPSSSKINLEKIILEPKLLKTRLAEARENAKMLQLLDSFNTKADIIDDTVGDTLSTLEDAKVSVGAKNLRDFLIKMKKELTGILTNDPADSYEMKKTKHGHPHKKTKKISEEDKEVGKFIETLFNKSRNKPKIDDKVGLYLPPELMKPFMGRASSKDLKTYFHDKKSDDVVGVALDDRTLHDFIGYLKNRENQKIETRNGFSPEENDDQVLGSINPLMYERLYNQTLTVKTDSKIDNPQEFFLRASPPIIVPDPETGNSNTNQTVGRVLAINGNIVKPFMGQARPQVLEDFFQSYNNPEEIIPVEHQENDDFEE